MSDLTTPTPHQMIDLSGLGCPNLVIAIIDALRPLSPGQILQVIATELNAPSNITAWSRQSGHTLIEMYEENDCFIFYLKRNGKVSAATPSFTDNEGGNEI
jgi:TusA-related sulfurtransferase